MAGPQDGQRKQEGPVLNEDWPFLAIDLPSGGADGYTFTNQRLQIPIPTKPAPNRSKDVGSGTLAVA